MSVVQAVPEVLPPLMEMRGISKSFPGVKALDHVDVTLICEQPKIRPHHAAMVARVAEIAGLDAKRVSVKATTTEKLGFTGREEGIAGQAIATVLLPDD